MKKQIAYSISLLSIIGSMWSQGVLALGNGDSLQFSGNSYFGIEFFPGFIMNTPIQSHDGIIIGQEQPADGSHAGFPNGTENPSIDEPWAFFGNTGMFQSIAGSGGVSVINDDGAGNIELDFSGIGVTWNGIPNINLGGAPSYPSDTGVATMTCAPAPCTNGSSYVLDYSAHVPNGDPSGFGGVLFVLHLEGTVNLAPEIVRLNINLPDGLTQECSAQGGSMIRLEANTIVPQGDAVESVIWAVDGTQVAEGVSTSAFVGLGEHNIAAVMTTRNGLSAADLQRVVVRDTTRPEAIARFVVAATGEAVTQVNKASRIAIQVGATDICDANPEITYSEVEKNNSVSVEDGDTFVALPKGMTNILQFEESLRLSVTARDASGNYSSTSTVLNIMP